MGGLFGLGGRKGSKDGAGAAEPSTFAITPDELGAVCNFDERDNAEHIRKFIDDFGGVQAVARRLSTDLTGGLACRAATAAPGSLKGPAVAGAPGSGGATTLDIVDVAGEATVGGSGRIAPGPPSSTDLPPPAAAAAGPAPSADVFASGVTDKDARGLVFGTNIIPPPRSETIIEIILGTIWDDTILKTLIVGGSLVLALGTGLCPSTGWIEGVAILVAVAIVLTVVSTNDYLKDQKFKKLLLLQSDKRCKVIRSGFKDEISSWDLLVGDLVALASGDEVPADGIFVSGLGLQLDESPLTGETEPVKKHERSPFLFSGALTGLPLPCATLLMRVSAAPTHASRRPPPPPQDRHRRGGERRHGLDAGDGSGRALDGRADPGAAE
jgi:Ca2+-transporting ATPase